MARKKGSGKMVGMTQISISLPESLVQQIDELAKMDRTWQESSSRLQKPRKRLSNLIVFFIFGRLDADFVSASFLSALPALRL